MNGSSIALRKGGYQVIAGAAMAIAQIAARRKSPKAAARFFLYCLQNFSTLRTLELFFCSEPLTGRTFP